jgi:hypothetical protein
LDVKNVFLNSILDEQVYYYQPTGFVDAQHKDHICKLVKSLYGLKQASWAWFQCFATFVVTIGFTASRSDTSLFLLRRGANAAYLLLYIDNIVLTASPSTLLHALIAKLMLEFVMKDLGPLH